ncbi:UPF0158 family protein [Candidatus Protochlamydia amoebophila]|uniref:Uncharacterized protein n=2 Tax=Candidatus Protochlamydia amoebophila TaxID=362787 RepID=Q6ME34_PARUW|nr:UPF0158 family protein [Candidatus Protochlamydia amoebophila]KIC73383.1 UPF0158 protein [Candidatus Protochlamydia amoebophila]CAF23165.1 unnamed protein product [Candidatus Protochlamydia amoebophila UWE25]
MCASKTKQEAQNPLILRCHRLMEAFAKSDDERDFFIDRLEGFLIYVDLDKPQNELDALQKELAENSDRYCQIPKLSFYETKKIMEGFVNEKVYDIDTKEKLLDIIQSKEARENFLEFIYDHHSEQEKWQQFYQERSRIRIIEWLRLNHFHFVFEEDLDLPRQLVEKLKHSLFQSKVGKDILTARKNLFAKAKTYYSNEALNPRPKRGRPPKQAAKPEIEPQVTIDIFTTVPPTVRPFLFVPNIQSSHFSAFSSKFDSEDDLLTNRRQSFDDDTSISQKLASLRTLSNRWAETQNPPTEKENNPYAMDNSFDDEDDDDDDEDFTEKKQKKAKEKPIKAKAASKSAVVTKATKPAKPEKPKAKRIIPKAKKEAMPTKGKVLKKIMPKKES